LVFSIETSGFWLSTTFSFFRSSTVVFFSIETV